MKISIIQPDITWEDKSGNFKNLSRLISPLFNETDLIILPEMFNTGFTMHTEQFSEPANGPTFEWLNEIAMKGNLGVCGSYIVRENDSYFNRWVFAGPGNEHWHYDKRHLFSMGSEDKYFTPGGSKLVFEFLGVRISPYICYDLRFPVWSRNRNDYDLAVYSANWPEVRGEVWKTLLKARAIENQCYVAGCNRIGTDGSGIKYGGDSYFINPRGEIVKSALTDSECSITSEISLTELSEFRKKFPVINDADDFTINA